MNGSAHCLHIVDIYVCRGGQSFSMFTIFSHVGDPAGQPDRSHEGTSMRGSQSDGRCALPMTTNKSDYDPSNTFLLLTEASYIKSKVSLMVAGMPAETELLSCNQCWQMNKGHRISSVQIPYLKVFVWRRCRSGTSSNVQTPTWKR